MSNYNIFSNLRAKCKLKMQIQIQMQIVSQNLVIEIILKQNLNKFKDSSQAILAIHKRKNSFLPNSMNLCNEQFNTPNDNINDSAIISLMPTKIMTMSMLTTIKIIHLKFFLLLFTLFQLI